MKIASIPRMQCSVYQTDFELADLDVLVNNAGANWNEAVDTYPDDAFEKVVNLNLKRIFTLTQA